MWFKSKKSAQYCSIMFSTNTDKFGVRNGLKRLKQPKWFGPPISTDRAAVGNSRSFAPIPHGSKTDGKGKALSWPGKSQVSNLGSLHQTFGYASQFRYRSAKLILVIVSLLHHYTPFHYWGTSLWSTHEVAPHDAPAVCRGFDYKRGIKRGATNRYVMVPRAGSGNSKTGVQCIPSTRKICTCTEPVLISNLYKREYLVHPPILSAETQLLICFSQIPWNSGSVAHPQHLSTTFRSALCSSGPSAREEAEHCGGSGGGDPAGLRWMLS